NFNSPSVVISGYLANGALFDPDDRLGLAQFTSLGLMRGTQRRDFHQIYDALESAGASMGFSAGVHTTSFSGRSLSEDLPLLLALLAEAVRQPAFPPDQIERLRAQLLTGLTIRAQDTGEMASLAFDELVFAGHPYARPEDGFIETVQPITAADLAAYHHTSYGPRGMVIAVVGAVDPQDAVAQVQQALGDWANPEQRDLPPLPPLQPLTEEKIRQVIIPGKSQADLVLGSQGPRRRSPDYMPASLGNSVLGQFGMYGRIGDVVREQSGLAYYSYGSLNAGQGPGSWEVVAGINPVNLDRTIDLVRQEIRRFVDEPVSQDELADSQANYIGRLPLSLESNSGVASALLNLERYELGMDYYRRYADLVRAVTPAQVLEVARRYLDPDRLVITSAGSFGEA
ncbi:MAG TPA: pitrilysin family protein, partial [Anaerolineaceae bacterium]